MKYIEKQYRFKAVSVEVIFEIGSVRPSSEVLYSGIW